MTRRINNHFNKKYPKTNIFCYLLGSLKNYANNWTYLVAKLY